MDTTEDLIVRFNAVANDTAIAVRANRRQRVDRALEAVEDVTLSGHDYFKRLVILVFANFAFGHTQFVRARGGSRRCFFYRSQIDSSAWSAGIIDAGYRFAPRNCSGLERGGTLQTQSRGTASGPAFVAKLGETLGVFLLPNCKGRFSVPSVLGIVSARVCRVRSLL